MSKKVYAGADIIFDNRAVFEAYAESISDVMPSTSLLTDTGISSANYMYRYNRDSLSGSYRLAYQPYRASENTYLTVPSSLRYAVKTRVTITNNHRFLYLLNI